MKLTFLGAAGTVTGSKYLLESDGGKILVDCGLYQGIKHYRKMNWEPLPVEASQIDAVILTHAHVDHSGYLPRLVKQGFSGPVYASQGTCDLCRILLPDSGYLQEEDARHAAKYGYSKHKNPLPLYTEEEARQSLKQLKPVSINEPHKLPGGLTARFRPAGHILGASTIEIFDGSRMVVFSGDVGRLNDLIMYPPEPIKRADYLVVESTYGNREHRSIEPEKELASIINKTSKQGGTVLIPAFAVGRAQTILYLLQKLKSSGQIPGVPIYLNSPMAIRTTELFHRSHGDHQLTVQDCKKIDAMTHYIRTVEESIALAENSFPSVIVSASGMACGGRVLHHLKALLPNHRNTILFVGFQAPGTRGEAMINGASHIKIHGEQIPVKASVKHLDAMSAHADNQEIITWLRSVGTPPKQVFVTHGEPDSAAAMQQRITEQLGWNATVPGLGDCVELR